MKRALIAMTLIIGIAFSATAFAGAETQCVAYGNANALSYCVKYMVRRQAVNTAGMNPHNAQLYTQLVAQGIAPGYGMYAAPVEENTALRAISTLGAVSANIMAASAWAYNWRHGYVGANGIYGAAYMMNYPW